MLRSASNDALRKATGLSDMAACQVPHCWNAQAVSFTFPTGFKFSYSGDCRPSKDFAKIGKGSTVLLHEATFDDELQGDAEAKKHSTTSEAIGVGLAMGAQRVILTHFSQRYQKIPIMDNMAITNLKLESADETQDSDIPVVENVSTDAPMLAGPMNVQNPANVITDSTSIEGAADPEASVIESTESKPDAGYPQKIKGQQRNSSKTSLQHSRYASDIAIIPSSAKDLKICIAFDYMRIKVDEIAHMDKYSPALLELYQQEVATEEASKMASNDQLTTTLIKKHKKRDEDSDDEVGTKGHKKSNEEVNRGKPLKVKQRKKCNSGSAAAEGGKSQSREHSKTASTEANSSRANKPLNHVQNQSMDFSLES